MANARTKEFSIHRQNNNDEPYDQNSRGTPFTHSVLLVIEAQSVEYRKRVEKSWTSYLIVKA